MGERVGGELQDGEELVLGDEALGAAVELAEALVLGLALEAGLGAVLALMHVAGALDREAADVAGSEDPPSTVVPRPSAQIWHTSSAPCLSDFCDLGREPIAAVAGLEAPPRLLDLGCR